MADPQTSLHFAANGNFTSDGQYAPGADGFNLADVSSVDEVNSLPTGVKGLVWLGMGDGVTQAFINAVTPFIGNPNVYAFYLQDEPDTTGQWGPYTTPANLKAESDWIHQHDPGAKTFIVEMNQGTEQNPVFMFNPANTDIDLYGLDPYPVRPEFSGGADYSVIGDSVTAAEAQGIPLSQIVPVYQAFGGGNGDYATYTLPTASQEQQILSTWGSLVPHPAFDYAYSWGIQSNDSALVDSPALQQVFAAHNEGSSSPVPSPPPPSSGSVLTATDSQGVTASVPVIASGSQDFTGPLAGTVHQTVISGVDNISANAAIVSENLQFGSGAQQIKFIGSQPITVTGGTGSDTVTGTSGNNSFIAGSGTLDVTGGAGSDAYVYHGGGLLRIEDFSFGKGDSLTVNKSLEGSLQKTSDGHGGTMISFGSATSGIDIVNHPRFAVSRIHFA